MPHRDTRHPSGAVRDWSWYTTDHQSEADRVPILELPAAPSHDPDFLDSLHHEGLHVGQNDQDAIKLGRTICGQLDNGQSEQQQEQLAVNNGLSAQDAHKFVVISVINLCSEHVQQINSAQTIPPRLAT